MRTEHKIITCRSLAPVLRDILGSDEQLVIMEIALHLQPERLRNALNEKVADIEEDGGTILLGYGLCGRGLEGVVSLKGRLVLPRVDDCVGMLLGSRQRHKQVMKDYPGSYFLETDWMDTELNIFTEMNKGMDHISKNRRKDLIRLALKHYKHLVLLSDENHDCKASLYCKDMAGQFDMTFLRVMKHLDLIEKLVTGPWNDDEFIVVPKGTPIPLF